MEPSLPFPSFQQLPVCVRSVDENDVIVPDYGMAGRVVAGSLAPNGHGFVGIGDEGDVATRDDVAVGI